MTTNLPPVVAVHRALFRALLDLRMQGVEQKNKVVFHLADLFHNIVLELENAAEGKTTYDEVLRLLEEQAREIGIDRWLAVALSDAQNTLMPNPVAP